MRLTENYEPDRPSEENLPAVVLEGTIPCAVVLESDFVYVEGGRRRISDVTVAGPAFLRPRVYSYHVDGCTVVDPSSGTNPVAPGKIMSGRFSSALKLLRK